MSGPLGYLDLVIEAVRGRSPVPELMDVKVDRGSLAAAHFEFLKQKFPNQHSGNDTIDMVLAGNADFLTYLWSKAAPAALTMCGDKSLAQLTDALRLVEAEKIPGDFIEAGVWRGGLPLIMRAFLHDVQNKRRKVWLADSFQGLPSAGEDLGDQAAHILLEPVLHLRTTRRQVEAAFEYFGLLDAQVEFLEGWFEETLPKMPATQFAIIRLDGDYYESTRDSLASLYPRLSPGGFPIIDDYNLPLGCKRAVDEYRTTMQISEPMVEINHQAVFWRKGAN
jgi:hypothetical protein